MSESAPLSVVVLAGGISHERDVSLRSGRRIADALTQAGHAVVVRDPDATLLEFLMESKPDVIFPALHGSSGEDGSLLELLSAINLPAVGSDAGAARRAWAKPIASSIIRQSSAASVPTSVSLSHESFRELGARSVLAVAHDFLAGDGVVVKPSSGGSAQGVTIVESAEDLPRAMVSAFTYADVAMIEQRIVGSEISVAVLDTGDGPTALPAVEIVPSAGIYSFQARYNAGETTFFAPARLDPQVVEHASAAAVRVHSTLGLGDLSRIDFIVDARGEAWFLEANVMPGLTETSLLPIAVRASGTTMTDVADRLVRAAASRRS